jgi:hypothetical protein
MPLFAVLYYAVGVWTLKDGGGERGRVPFCFAIEIRHFCVCGTAGENKISILPEFGSNRGAKT